jgi:hypothetical protein
MPNDKQNDKQLLEKLNNEMGNAESEGDLKWLTDIIAPEFAFRRASGKIDGGVDFLKAVKASGPRKTDIESVDVYGKRAIIKCIVTIGDSKFHNIRLFVWIDGQEGQGGQWKLLGWANEPL